MIYKLYKFYQKNELIKTIFLKNIKLKTILII